MNCRRCRTCEISCTVFANINNVNRNREIVCISSIIKMFNTTRFSLLLFLLPYDVFNFEKIYIHTCSIKCFYYFGIPSFRGKEIASL